jgi:hypothetical protein
MKLFLAIACLAIACYMFLWWFDLWHIVRYGKIRTKKVIDFSSIVGNLYEYQRVKWYWRVLAALGLILIMSFYIYMLSFCE